MRTFDLVGFIAHMAKMPAVVLVEQHLALEAAARIVKAEAKAELGHYQTDTGPFPPWAGLAQSTQDERFRQGFQPDDPELREGVLRDAIEHTAGDTEAVVGVKDHSVRHSYQTKDVNIGEVAEAQELGTHRLPPRSFLGVAGHRRGQEVADICGRFVVRALVGDSVHGGKMPIP